jgi:hypothetical protein
MVSVRMRSGILYIRLVSHCVRLAAGVQNSQPFVEHNLSLDLRRFNHLRLHFSVVVIPLRLHRFVQKTRPRHFLSRGLFRTPSLVKDKSK